MIVKCDVYTNATCVCFPDLVQLSGKYREAAPAKYGLVLLSSTYTMRTLYGTLFFSKAALELLAL